MVRGLSTPYAFTAIAAKNLCSLYRGILPEVFFKGETTVLR